MKKNYNKGFLLVETLVVSTFCLTILVILFLQFKNLIINYNTSFKYNSVENIYNLNVVKKYLKNNRIRLSDPTYIYDGNDYHNYCNPSCRQIIELEEIKILIYTKSTINDNIKNNNNLSAEMYNFINKLKPDSKQNRLIAEFNNGTYASITY
ncbi:MAG: hypothetical protein IKE75_00420 [Bacilli bacterium]|nr:hypothetical protein [Bacilli bacterium]